MQCTKCNSENTQRLEVVYDYGTQNISTTSHSAGAGIGGTFGVGGVRTSTSGTSQSNLAYKVAPPARKASMWTFISIFIGLLCFAGSAAMIFFGVLLIALGGYFAYVEYEFNSKDWPQLHQYWKESWLCHKCGNIYHQP